MSEPMNQPSALPDRNSTPQPERAGCRSFVVGALLLVVLGAVLVWIYQLAVRADAERRAPIVVDVEATACSLSPGGRFLHVSAAGVALSDFFDAITGEHISLSLPPDGPHLQPAGMPQPQALWLRDETYFVYDRWTNADHGYHIPQNGWLIDVANRMVTNVLRLDTAERQALLDLVSQTIRRGSNPLPATSPNGIYTYYFNGTIVDTSGQELNRFPWRSRVEACGAGWRHDSSGVYFAEQPRRALLDRLGQPGPIRMLLVHPPPGVPPWVWPALGGVLGLTGYSLGWRYWRRRQK
jgi:hypothetical protein